MAERTDRDRDDEIARLTSELEALRTLVAGLDADIRRAHGRVDLTMRKQLRCSACGGRKIAHAPEVLDRDHMSEEALVLFTTGFWSKEVGKLEAFVCMGCGLVEWWVSNPSTLVASKDDLHVLDGEAPGDNEPYR